MAEISIILTITDQNKVLTTKAFGRVVNLLTTRTEQLYCTDIRFVAQTHRQQGLIVAENTGTNTKVAILVFSQLGINRSELNRK